MMIADAGIGMIVIMICLNNKMYFRWVCLLRVGDAVGLFTQNLILVSALVGLLDDDMVQLA